MTTRILIIPVLLLVQLSVLAGKVNTFTANGVDLSSIKTFKMLPVRVLTSSGIQENDPTYGVYILAAVRKELTAKGLKEVAENPDVEVASGGLARAFPQLEALIYSYVPETDWGTGTITTIGRYNKEGTVIVNFINPKVKKGVWLGVSSRPWGKPSTADKMIEKATAEMFKKYPPLQ